MPAGQFQMIQLNAEGINGRIPTVANAYLNGQLVELDKVFAKDLFQQIADHLESVLFPTEAVATAPQGGTPPTRPAGSAGNQGR